MRAPKLSELQSRVVEDRVVVAQKWWLQQKKTNKNSVSENFVNDDNIFTKKEGKTYLANDAENNN